MGAWGVAPVGGLGAKPPGKPTTDVGFGVWGEAPDLKKRIRIITPTNIM